MGNILYLEKRGCNFFNDEPLKEISDVGNYRVGSYNYSIAGKDGNNYIIEFTRCQKRRFTNKRTGKPLKKYIVEHDHKLYMSTQYENDSGCWGNVQLDEIIYKLELDYTLKDILAAVNLISKDEYTSIEFINWVLIFSPVPSPIEGIGEHKERINYDFRV